jgi:hypothetical protein
MPEPAATTWTICVAASAGVCTAPLLALGVDPWALAVGFAGVLATLYKLPQMPRGHLFALVFGTTLLAATAAPVLVALAASALRYQGALRPAEIFTAGAFGALAHLLLPAGLKRWRRTIGGER